MLVKRYVCQIKALKKIIQLTELFGIFDFNLLASSWNGVVLEVSLSKNDTLLTASGLDAK